MNRTVILGIVTVLVVAGGAAWYLYFQEDAMFAPAPPPKPAAAAPKPAPQAAATPKPEAPKPAAAPDPKDPVAMDNAIKASQARASDLEKQVADLQKQVEAKNKEIAEMEKKVSAKK
jgi:hypothetical protein